MSVPNMRSDDTRVVVVTGGAAGIGAAIADRFCNDGYLVVIADINEAAARARARVLRGRGHQSIAEPVDVSSSDSINQLFQQIQTRVGYCDVLINNAGIAGSTPLEELPLRQWEKTLSVNVTGTLLASRAVLPLMRLRGQGRIVNMASVSGLRAGIGRTAYGTSKAAVIGLTRQMAVELAGERITVNTVAPGPVDTAMTRQFYTPAMREGWRQQIPAGRFGTPEEVAAAFAFLASPESSYITGHTLPVDGGFMSAGVLSS